ncbi:restriction endonuclease subunit S [Aeromonas hydrophila]|uniref:restriction endonuclease subunit S n=1 Tax=Aeromonas hydrophila TaxID=644 RepID=UPI002B4597A2|nr:restriction endonuclease subunit S [Aeromonas hydrophila]
MAEQMIQHKEGEKVATQAIPTGFKWTEIGIIPEDWIIEKLGMYASFRTGPFGSALHKSDYVIDGIPIVNPMQIIDGGIIPTSSMSISTTAATKLSEFRLQTGDIVIGRRGEMGRCAVVGIEENGWLCGTGSMIIRIKSSCESRFIQRVLSSKEIIAAIESSSVGTTMINLNQSTLRELKIFIPSNKNEQLAIATVLSDTDALISGLEQLIAKKQAIKTATLQQLLTGRTRLPQFALRPDGTSKGYKTSELGQIPEDWEVVSLGDASQFINGRAYALHEWESSGVPVIRLQNLTGRGDEYYYSNLKLPERQYCDFGDLLFMWSATFGPVIWKGSKAIYHYHIWKIECKSGNNKTFLFYLLGDMTERLKSNSSSGGTMLHVTKEKMELTKSIFPSVEEQTAIATILSDMDNELQALTQKLEKARALKQGMMQQLLTGKIRLPLPKEA